MSDRDGDKFRAGEAEPLGADRGRRDAGDAWTTVEST